MPNNTATLLRNQWSNPQDVLSLLLLIGGDIVQKAIAQLTGYTFQPVGQKKLSIGFAPVAFSFGWVAYGFINLLAAVSTKTIMPAAESPSIVVNCANGFTRVNRSWVLERLLRDHEITHEIDPTDPLNSEVLGNSSTGRAESIRIDIFELGKPLKPKLDMVWWLGWMTIVLQIVIACIPWTLYEDFGILLIVLSGNLLGLLTTSMPQWRMEKWACRTLRSGSVICLTRGNGHLHVMVIIGSKGSWDLENLATAISAPRYETSLLSLILAFSWACLLVTVSGLREHTWYLVGTCGIGMLQNVYAAGAVRNPCASNLNLRKFARMPTIIGKRQSFKDDLEPAVDLQEAMDDVAELSNWTQGYFPQSASAPVEKPKWLETMRREDGAPAWLASIRKLDEISNVHGALKELEKWVPTAGLAMIKVFFPESPHYQDYLVRDNVHKKFWRRAYYTKRVRRRAEEKRREQAKMEFV